MPRILACTGANFFF
jgi:hAT family C-terminal dimerisation region